MSIRTDLQHSGRRAVYLCLLASITSGGASPATPQVPDELILLQSTDDSGVKSEFAVSEARLCGTKPWRPETDPLPLPIAAAIQAAKKGLGNSQSKWIVTAVALNASGRCDNAFRWYYTVEMYDEAQAATDIPRIIERIVLMDGSVVLPRPSAR